MQDTIQSLEENIQKDIESVKAKRKILKAMKAKERQNTPFSATKFGKAYFGALRTITKPFADLNQTAHTHLESPYVMQSENYVKRSDKLLAKCKKMSREISEEKSTRLALQAAELVMELSDFLDRHPLFNNILSDNLMTLRNQVEILRPPRDEEKAQQVKDLINNHFDNVPVEV